MSIANLFVPNDYSLYCDNLTVEDNLTINGSVTFAGNLNVNGLITSTNTSNSASRTDTTAAISTQGGLSVAKNINSCQITSNCPGTVTGYAITAIKNNGSDFANVLLENLSGSVGTQVQMDASTYNLMGNLPAARIAFVDDDFSDDVQISNKAHGAIGNALVNTLLIKDIGITTQVPLIIGNGTTFTNAATGYTPSTLAYYEVITISTTFGGIFSTPQATVLTLVKTGQMVTGVIKGVLSNASVATTMTLTATIPSRMLPIQNQNNILIPIPVSNNNGATPNSTGMLSIVATSGAISVYASIGFGLFSGSSSSGVSGIYDTTFSYVASS